MWFCYHIFGVDCLRNEKEEKITEVFFFKYTHFKSALNKKINIKLNRVENRLVTG